MVTPIRACGKPRAVHMSVNRTSSLRGTATIARPADSENSTRNGSSAVRDPDPGPDAAAQARLDQRLGHAAVADVVRGVDQAVA